MNLADKYLVDPDCFISKCVMCFRDIVEYEKKNQSGRGANRSNPQTGRIFNEEEGVKSGVGSTLPTPIKGTLNFGLNPIQKETLDSSWKQVL